MSTSRMQLSRRDLLKLGLLGSAALYLPVERIAKAGDVESLAKLPTPFTYPFLRPPDVYASAHGNNLTMAMAEVPAKILAGGTNAAYPQTKLWAYTFNGLVNPTIHAEKGQPVDITHVNGLPARHPQHGYESWTSVHLHGSASLPQYDGYASDVIKPGQRKTYKYANAQGARTLWYHDHGVHRTAQNAYAGLAGQYHLHDSMERASGIPTGANDIPVTIKDALFAKDGTLMYDDDGQDSLMGDVILVNGVPWPVMQVQKRLYRLRFLNASISRSFRLSVSDSRVKMYAIATDGGFMPKPVQISNFRLGMAERYEIVLDFSACPDNTSVTLRSAEVENNVDFTHTRKVMLFKVLPGAVVPKGPGNMLPSAFYTPRAPQPGNGYLGPDEIMGLTASMAVKTRHFRLERTNGSWTINGSTWDEVVRSGYKKTIADVAPGSIEIWNWENSSGGWFHPLHIHLVDFKILRRIDKGSLQSYEQGPKDTAYVGEGETVSLIMRFSPHTGRYMVHCHNLVHEDHDMMAQYRVGTDTAANDPMTAAPAY